jgi:hypothetical protein
VTIDSHLAGQPDVPATANGPSMQTVTRNVGVALVVVGVGGYVGTGAKSVTALAPSVVGALLLVLWAVARNPVRRRTAIHSALGVALVGLLASGMPLMDLPVLLTGGDVERPAAVLSAAAMAVLCLVYLVLGIRSFRAARRVSDGVEAS